MSDFDICDTRIVLLYCFVLNSLWPHNWSCVKPIVKSWYFHFCLHCLMSTCLLIIILILNSFSLFCYLDFYLLFLLFFWTHVPSKVHLTFPDNCYVTIITTGKALNWKVISLCLDLDLNKLLHSQTCEFDFDS